MNNKVVNMKYRFMQKAETEPHKLYVYDEVTAKPKIDWETWDIKNSETSAKYFRDRLSEIPDGDPIELHVNSIGGDVMEGVAIFNLLRQKSQQGCRLTGYVDGGAYSIAMDIVLACDEVHMGLGTSMFLHYPWTIAAGNAEQLMSVAEQLESLGNASVGLYLGRSKGKVDEKTLREMMRKETMLDPETCLQYGFCDMIDTYEAKKVTPEEDPEEDNEPEDPEEDEEAEKMAEMSRRIDSIYEMLAKRTLEEPKKDIKDTITKAAALFKARNNTF